MLLSSAADSEQAVRRHGAALEFLHPNGIVRTSIVIGSNAPAVLLPSSHMPGVEHADLVVLAPTATECRTARWLEAAVRSISREIARDGIAYVLIPPPWRARVKRLLRHDGFLIGPSILHLPNRTSSRYLVPLIPAVSRYACANVLPLLSWSRRLAALALRVPGIQELLGNVLPPVGFIARRAGSRPLLNWLFQLDGTSEHSGSAILSRSWRGENAGVILHRFLDGEVEPSAVIKTASRKCICEAATLASLGAKARGAGARVPQPLRVGRLGAQPVLLQTVVEGRVVATLLASRHKFLDTMERIVTWLEHWNLATRATRPLDATLLEREILAPAAVLAPLIHKGKDYRDWLAARCVSLKGLQAPFVATHNDLTMWNVLVDDHGRLGVIDWETAREDGWPLVDFLYAVTDAVTAVQGYVDRPKAFDACFASKGPYAHAVTRFLTRLRASIGIPDNVASMCFHACWLHHAANEHSSAAPSDPRPFLKIVQSIALSRNHVTA